MSFGQLGYDAAQRMRFFLIIFSAALLAACATPVKDDSMALSAPDAVQIEARYATSPSKFIGVDGVRMHYWDEGIGPTLIMLPGHLGNLRMFDEWADELKQDYRVIRLDWPPYGLSLPDPSGRYSTDRGTELVIGFMDRMEIPRATLIGTSNGATVAAHVASLHPDRVDRPASFYREILRGDLDPQARAPLPQMEK